MSLSSSTLNLKFMQRAAARNAQSSPSTPSTPNAGPSHSTPSHLGSTSTPQPTTLSILNTQTPASTTTPTSVGVQAEQEAQARWHLPRLDRLSLPTRPSETGRIRFESSYLPFLSGEEGEAGPSRVKSARAGGGRMAFGGFGEEAKEEEEDGDEEGEQDGTKVKKDKRGGQGVREANRALEMGIKREQPSTPTAPPPRPHTTSKGFHRPSNYTPDIPPSSSASSSRSRPRAEDIIDVKPSVPDSLKSKKKDSASNHTSGKKRAIPPDTGSEGTKRAKVDLSRPTPNGKVKVKVESDDPVPISRDEAGASKLDLDAREREMKAAKKREKKAKRKAKQEAE